MTQERQPSTGGVRAALWVILGGAVVALVALPFPVVGDFWDDQNDVSQIAVIDGDRAQFAIAFGLQGLGVLLIGVGLLMLGAAITPIETAQSRARGVAAQVAGWLGVVIAIGGLSRLLHALFATPEFYVDSDIDLVIVVLSGLGWTLSMVIFGVLAWSAPPPRWTAAVLVLGGLLNFVPEAALVALVVFTIANLFVMRGANSPDEASTAPSS